MKFVSYLDAVKAGEETLAAAGIVDAKIDAKYLFESMPGHDSNFLLLYGRRQMDEDQRLAYEALIQKRASHIPLQHILGYTEFMGLRFTVNEHVLCPRQDTETLVELAQSYLQPGCRVLDMCTGSGCILISLLALGKRGVVEPGGFVGVASDISEEALEVAKQNAEDQRVEIRFLQGDLFDSLQALPTEERRFDLIVSNPPYIPTAGVWSLMPEVRDHEPKIALDGSDTGLVFYERLTSQASEFLKPGGRMLVEIGYDQAEDVCQLFREHGFSDVVCHKDLAGNDRVVMGHL
ncbi:MAG: peptide chain release factor N(5)-glutamine methyltransferase [Lachnospiraceae bacterium]|nr:peptide chain release factor N(5)-glutamine methyltransferase [Lachnospiraceae bacterium]